MATRPTNRSLLIPGKNYKAAHDGYRKDMQSLEIWARQPIQQLIAGSGITLSPASGLATDAKGRGPNPITITATGGGGGGNAPAAFADIMAGPESLNPALGNWWPFSTPMIGPQLNGPSQTPIPLFQHPGSPSVETGSDSPAFGNSWFTIVSAGQTVNFLPKLETPPFTGGTGFLMWQFYYWAVSTDFTNGAMYTTKPANIPVGPFTSHQIAVADLVSVVTFGTDLTLTAGTGFTGNGLVSGGSLKPYFAGVNGSVVIPPGTTF